MKSRVVHDEDSKENCIENAAENGIENYDEIEPAENNENDGNDENDAQDEFDEIELDEDETEESAWTKIFFSILKWNNRKKSINQNKPHL